ncbi:MAG: hypothetical protein HYT72_02360 [Candidatus Aenigmarchaeota archaeon]|nr:hypothetical protein [Candidatus Aenigmarchaeota archaeon]
MTLIIVEFVSMFFLILSLLLLSAVLLKHFRGMALPAHWVYYLGAFALIAISTAFTRLLNADFSSVDVWLRFAANLSILLGSYEIFRHYESRISSKLKKAKPLKKRRKR